MTTATKVASGCGLQAGAQVLAQIWGQQPDLSSCSLGWDGLSVCVWNICIDDYEVNSVPEPLIALHTAGVIDRIGTLSAPASRSTPGRVSVFPMGSGGTFHGHGLAKMVTVHFSE